MFIVGTGISLRDAIKKEGVCKVVMSLGRFQSKKIKFRIVMNLEDVVGGIVD